MRTARNIYHRKDGRFEARYIKERGENGKAIYGAVYAKDYSEVREKLKKVKPTDNGKTAVKESELLKEILARYIESLRNKLKPTTIAIYERNLTNHIEPFFGDIKGEKLTKELVQEFANKKILNGLSVSTVQSVLLLLKAGLKNHIPSGLLTVNLPIRRGE
ncbi:hypothetical protein FACS189490_04320 [Clostridia bacterium]|nr:hypothetical protein FACS189490_04320 [Clostridia bacterium]